MSKNKQILLALFKGGSSQDAIAATLHVSKRDVSAAAKAVGSGDVNGLRSFVASRCREVCGCFDVHA